MGYDRQWLESCGSEDSNGRTLWALGPDGGALALAGACATGHCICSRRPARYADELGAPRAKAFAALGGYELLAGSARS